MPSQVGAVTFLHHRYFYAIYPAILTTGTILKQITPDSIYSTLQRSAWVSSKNVINRAFAHGGNTIFLVVFTCLALFQVWQSYTRSRLDTPAHLRTLAKYTIKLIMKYVGLYAIFYVIDHIFLWTGGKCVISREFTSALASSITSFDKCFEVNGTWVRLNEGFCSLTPTQFTQTVSSAERCYEVGHWEGGFDISGHYCFLVTLSLIFWNELVLLQHSEVRIDLESQKLQAVESSWLEFRPVNVVRWTFLLVLMVWINMLLVTAMFYHTAGEKVLGLVLGYATPVLIYYGLPNVPLLHAIF